VARRAYEHATVRGDHGLADMLQGAIDQSIKGLSSIVEKTPIPGVYALPHFIPLRTSPSYEQGKVYGIDIASVVAVIALLPSRRAGALNKEEEARPILSRSHVLDLCCAPGGKLAILADLIECPPLTQGDDTSAGVEIETPLNCESDAGKDDENGATPDLADPVKFSDWETERGTVTGVDVDLTRLLSAKSLVMKHGLRSVRLYCDDACGFDERPTSKLATPPVKGRRLEAQQRFATHLHHLTASSIPGRMLQPPVWRCGIQIPSHSAVSQELGGALVLGAKRALDQQTNPTQCKSSATYVAQKLKQAMVDERLQQNEETNRQCKDIELEVASSSHASIGRLLEEILRVPAPGSVLAGCPCVQSSPLAHIVKYSSPMTSPSLNYSSHVTSKDSKLAVEYERRIRKLIIQDESKSQDGDAEQRLRMRENEEHPEITEIDEKESGESEAPQQLYDAVLVDAECTHDGSIRHLPKEVLESNGTCAAGSPNPSKGVNPMKMLDSERLEGLYLLQRSLLANGFRLLKPLHEPNQTDGSALCYSTCSFAMSQNEDIVAWLLATQPCAVCEPIPWSTLDVRAEMLSQEMAANSDARSKLTDRLFYLKCKPCPPRVAVAACFAERLLSGKQIENEELGQMAPEASEIYNLIKGARAQLTDDAVWNAILVYMARLRNAYEQVHQYGVRFGPSVCTSGLFVCRINKLCKHCKSDSLGIVSAATEK